MHDLVIKTTKDSQFQHPSTFSHTVTCELLHKLFSPDNHEKWVQNPLLLPANEVWGKVMFLHLCVILFTGQGGGLCPSIHHKSHDRRFSVQGVSVQGGSLSGSLCPEGPLSRGSLSRGGSLTGGVSVHGSLCPLESLSGGVCPRGNLCLGGSLSRGSLSGRPHTVTSRR